MYPGAARRESSRELMTGQIFNADIDYKRIASGRRRAGKANGALRELSHGECYRAVEMPRIGSDAQFIAMRLEHLQHEGISSDKMMPEKGRAAAHSPER